MKKQNKKKETQLKNPIFFIKKAKIQILAVTAIFILSILIGFLNADLLTIIDQFLEEIIEKTEGLDSAELIAFIFINNALTSLYGLMLGIFLGIFPIIISLTNGIVLGYVLERTVQVAGILEFWRLLPHGIFELPAVFISLGIGLKLGLDTIRNYIKAHRKNIGMQFLGIFSILLGLLSIMPLKQSINALQGTSQTQIPNFLILFILGITLIIPFILLFFVIDKKLRKNNLVLISNSINVFILVIIPLLLIAAIIEGLLITLL